ncbi:MAG: efflux RND transporter periplasmic adaptor subunit [Chitinophagaceae bacterium]|nr:efflux RND transporter periplasmic adaptor subunit [Chitinophagaceae bacterium]
MRQNVLISLCAALAVMSSCNNMESKQTEKPLEVPVVSIRSVPLQLDKQYVTDIQAIRNVEVRSKVSGFLDAIYVDEGAKVSKGQVLFRIGDNEYKAQVAKARAVLHSMSAEANVAELEAERVRLMVEKKIIAATELELAKSKLKAARARVEEAQSTLDHATHLLSYTVIRAPFDGVVDRIPLKTGSLVSEGTLITTVSDVNSVYAYFNISENEYLAFNKNDDPTTIDENKVATLILSDGTEYRHKGKIETVVSEFNENTGAISVRAAFPNPDHLLKHNATGKVKLVSGKVESLVLPQKAAFEIQDKNYVYVVGVDNVIKMRSFDPSGRYGQYYIVNSGLMAGDKIVFEGIQNLREGVKVIPRSLPVDSLPGIAAQ